MYIEGISMFRSFLQVSLRVSLFPQWSLKVSHVHRRYIKVYLMAVAEGILQGIPLLLKVSFKVSFKVSQVSFEVSLSAQCAVGTALERCGCRSLVEFSTKLRHPPVSKFGRSLLGTSMTYILNLIKCLPNCDTKVRPNFDTTSFKIDYLNKKEIICFFVKIFISNLSTTLQTNSLFVWIK